MVIYKLYHIGTRHGTHLRCEGSEGSEGSEGKVDGPTARWLWPPVGGRLCRRVVKGKVLKMDGPSAQGFLSLTAFQVEGCGTARRAMLIKSALRDWLYVS